MKRLSVVGVGLLILFTGIASAQCQHDSCSYKDLKARIEKLEKGAPTLKVSGQFFGYYTYSRFGTNGKDYNKFDMERSYITVRGTLAENWAAQLTTDLYRGSETNTYYKGFGVRMKFVYLEYILNPWSFRFGLIPGPFHATEEAAWKYRGVAQTPTDRYGYFSTADLGATVTYELPEKYGDLALSILNGKGFTNPETDKYKDVVLRATVKPLPSENTWKNLSLSGFTYLGYENGTRHAGLPKNRYGALAYFSHRSFSVGAEYISRVDAPSHPDTTVTGTVLSIVSEIFSPWEELSKHSLIFRYDRVDPNTAQSKDGYDFVIVGLTYKPNARVTFSLNYQGTFGDAKVLRRSTGGYVDYDERIYCHMIVNIQ